MKKEISLDLFKMNKSFFYLSAQRLFLPSLDLECLDHPDSFLQLHKHHIMFSLLFHPRLFARRHPDRVAASITTIANTPVFLIPLLIFFLQSPVKFQDIPDIALKIITDLIDR